MKHLRSVREMLGFGMQNGRELSMMFEQCNAVVCNSIDYRLRAERSFTDRKEPGLSEPSDPPAEAVPGALVAAKCHQFEELVMAGEFRVADLPQQSYIPVRLDDDAVLRVAHKTRLETKQSHPLLPNLRIRTGTMEVLHQLLVEPFHSGNSVLGSQL